MTAVDKIEKCLSRADRADICRTCPERESGGGDGFRCGLADCCTGRILAGEFPCPLGKFDVDVSVLIPHTRRKRWGNTFLTGAILGVLAQQRKVAGLSVPFAGWKIRILDDPDSTVDFDAVLAQVEKYIGGPLNPDIRKKIHHERFTTPLVGPKRQHLIDTETARVCLFWDDDDFYLPGYVADKLGRLAVSDKPIIFDHLAMIYSIDACQRKRVPHWGRGSAAWCFYTDWAKQLGVRFTTRRVASDTQWFDEMVETGTLGSRAEIFGSAPKEWNVICCQHIGNTSQFAAKVLRAKPGLLRDPGMIWLCNQVAPGVANFIRAELLPAVDPPIRSRPPPRPAQPMVRPGLGLAIRQARVTLEAFDASRTVDHAVRFTAAAAELTQATGPATVSAEPTLTLGRGIQHSGGNAVDHEFPIPFDPQTVPIQGLLTRQDVLALVDLCRGRRVVEYGMGGSTLLLARCAAELTSYEPTREWFDRTVRRVGQIPDNTCDPRLIWCVRFPSSIPDCDVLFLDGPISPANNRAGWIDRYLDRVGQLILIHDSNTVSGWKALGACFSKYGRARWIDLIDLHYHGSKLAVIHKRPSLMPIGHPMEDGDPHRVDPTVEDYAHD